MIDLLHSINALGADVWLDGGWGVDALLLKETRAHDDVDIVLQEVHLERVVKLLEERGFIPFPRDDTRAWNFVLTDAQDQRVDFHVIVFDDAGKGIYGPPEDDKFYPADAFTGRGKMANAPVKCMSAAFQIANRTGYEMRQKDRHDLKMLKAKFRIE
ncbi:nucleotidyltransferase domain-containing protein [Maritalea sp.]|uniref:nucleotidyltransferase domain-containing protein n=1 Tax=Maritalea sp. TaxID=2003361 RepID=UPI003EFA28EC